MKLLKSTPLWFISGILYGLSWPIFNEINLSFLAWFAFVPLLIFLEKNKNKFIKSMLGSYAAMIIFGCFSAGWLFNFPQVKSQIAAIFFLEDFWIFIPFLIFFIIQKRIGFNKTLWLLPLIWMIWEWAYLSLEFTMGTHLSAYSQSNNLWLIQYLDITGMWGISFWLLLFNVLIFKAYKSVKYNLKNVLFYKKTGVISLYMIGIPLLYGAFSYFKYNDIKGTSIQVSILQTQYDANFLINPKNKIQIVEEVLHRTDSIAFTMKDRNIFSDLYVWPETGLPFSIQRNNLSNLLFEAVKDWNSALLTGGRSASSDTNIEDKRKHISGVLISHKQKETTYHHKTILTPGQEAIPYHSLLAKMPFFSIKETDTRYFKKGNESKPLQLITKNGKKLLVGVSLCYEQWYPKHWAKLAKNGADFYTHLAGESWYGNFGFKSFMANVTRIRSIENRKQTARSANIGRSGFIDQMGRFHHISKENSLQTKTTKITTSKTTTIYTENPNWVPLLGLSVFLISLIFHLYYLKFYPLVK